MVTSHRLRQNTPERPGNSAAEQDPFYGRFLYILFLGVAVGALFLPAFGPLLDHHFAERQPGHTHVFLGPHSPTHLHFFEVIRGHSHPLDQERSAPGDIVYLTSYRGIGQDLPQFPVTTSGGSSIVFFPEAEDDPSLSGNSRLVSFLKESVVAPEKKPPRG